jgi:hypothetical protein
VAFCSCSIMTSLVLTVDVSVMTPDDQSGVISGGVMAMEHMKHKVVQ